MSRVFSDGLGDRSSIPGRLIKKTQKMVLDADLFTTQHYKLWIKSKMEQSREWSFALPYTGFWYLTPLVSSYPIFFCPWRLQRKKRKKAEIGDTFWISTPFCLCFRTATLWREMSSWTIWEQSLLPNQALKSLVIFRVIYRLFSAFNRE